MEMEIAFFVEQRRRGIPRGGDDRVADRVAGSKFAYERPFRPITAIDVKPGNCSFHPGNQFDRSRVRGGLRLRGAIASRAACRSRSSTRAGARRAHPCKTTSRRYLASRTTHVTVKFLEHGAREVTRGDAEKQNLCMKMCRTTPRTSGDGYVIFMTESAMFSRRILHFSSIWSKFLSEGLMRYRRPSCVSVLASILWRDITEALFRAK